MKLLVIRFSAFGDVAMTVPVIDSLARQYPQVDITVLSRPFVQPLFGGMPANVRFRGADLSNYKGLGGLVCLSRELRREGYDTVADLHDVLRGKIIRTFFALSGARTAHIDKGHCERRALVRHGASAHQPLPTSFARYEAVFSRLGVPVRTTFRSIYGEGQGDPLLFQAFTGLPDGKPWIGIAPFAAHRGKILPASTTETVIARLAERDDCRVFLFGGGKAETPQLEQWAAIYPNVTSLAGKLKLNQELALMSHLQVMVSMDSANMHLASLTATPVVSVWGATHPHAGFMGWHQSIDNAVQTDLPCRPCSVFGNRPCRRGDYACLTAIQAEDIITAIDHILTSNRMI